MKMDKTKIVELLVLLLTRPDDTATTTPAPEAAPYIGPPIGSMVVIRDNRDGVFWGRLVALDLRAGVWELADARQAWSWTGAAATPGLAVRGPTGGRIGPACSRAGRDLVSITVTTPEADAQWSRQPVWTP